MKLISDRDILKARAALVREIEAGRVGTSPPLSEDDVKRELNQRRKLGAGKKGTGKEPRKKAKNPMRPGEITLKECAARMAKERGIDTQSMIKSLIKSNYAGVPIRRVNARVIFVQMEPQTERKEG